MPDLEAVTVRGFTSIQQIENLSLRPINVLIGSNGSGKSNFIRIFSFLHAIREGHLQDYVARAGGAEHLLHFGSKVSQSIELQLVFRDSINQYRIMLAPTPQDSLAVLSEEVSYWDRRYPKPYSKSIYGTGKEAGISQPGDGISAYVREHLNRWRLYHFHDTSQTSPMKRTSDINDNSFLRPDGSNIAAFLHLLKAKHSNHYELIRRTIQRVAPFFDDFELKPQLLNPDKIRLEWKHKNSESYFDASSLSDGTIRFIALACLFMQPDEFRPSIILVDEPELGLHPYAITLLASMAKSVSEKTQVILSTQSALLLDNFEPEDVLVANVISGTTQIERLRSEGLEQWLETYSLGQLWEKNEFGGRPRQG